MGIEHKADPRIKILFVLPSLARGGAETQTVDLVNGLDPTRYEKHLVTFERRVDYQERIDNANVRYVHSLRRSKFDITPVLEIARLIDEQAIDIVHCSLQIALLVGWLALRRAKRKAKLIVALHTTRNRNTKDELFDRMMYQWLMRSCAAVICVCRNQEAFWHRKYPFLRTKTRIIYNGVDAKKFEPESQRQAGEELRRELAIPSHAKVICHIAGFRSEKGHAILINAFEQVAAQVPDVILMLVGDGVLRPDIERMVCKRGLAERVRFLGNQADVRPAIAAADCSVLPSTAVETFSIAMLESLAMKVPMVASDVGGTAEAILENETGLLVPPGDSRRLAEALVRVLSDRQHCRRMGENGSALVRSKFTVEQMLEQTSSLIDEVYRGYA